MRLKTYKYSAARGLQKIKTKTAIFISIIGLAVSGGTGLSLAVFGSAHAASDVIVTPSDTQGWSTADTNSGGTVTFNHDTSAPGSPNNGALELTTDSDNASRAQYVHTAGVNLSDVTELSYSTKQITGPSYADSNYQLEMCLGGVTDGTCNGYTTMVYEAYWSGTVTPGEWQSWDVMSGHLWSSKDYTDSSNASCTVTKAPGGPPTYTIAGLKEACPSAVVTSYGTNVGTYNPGYDVEVDSFDFNGTVYNFEPVVASGQITSPSAGEHVSGTLNLAATYSDGDTPNNDDGVQWAVRAGTCAAGTGTVFGNVDGHNDAYTWDGNNFSSSLDTTTLADGNYCFVFNPVDDPGQPNVRETSNFVVNNTPDNKDQCKDGGWANFTLPSFKNQGQCVSYTNHHDGVGADDQHAKNS